MRVLVVYNEFVSMLKQNVVVEELFPLVIPKSSHEYGETSFDSSKKDMLLRSIPEYIHSIIYRIVLNSLQSETSKRMIAMDSASTNCKEMIETLTLKYNRARQTKVTMELIEVVSGIQ
jgi:F-type H+-transporting ATPase subunit gamma